jgi:small subunit ribosomal protein S5
MADELNNRTQDSAQEQEQQPAATEGAQAAPESQAPHEERGHRGGHGDRRGGRGGQGGRGRGPRDGGRDREEGGLEEVVVRVYRCATVVKGGRRFSFGALVVVGDRKGQVGIGYGKANEVPSAVEKATKVARRNVISVKLAGTTIPHQAVGRYGASKVVAIPAGEGTGVIAGASVRAVMELAGVKDVLTKCFGSTSPKNLVKAAFLALTEMRTKDDIARLRAVSIA